MVSNAVGTTPDRVVPPWSVPELYDFLDQVMQILELVLDFTAIRTEGADEIRLTYEGVDGQVQLLGRVNAGVHCVSFYLFKGVEGFANSGTYLQNWRFFQHPTTGVVQVVRDNRPPADAPEGAPLPLTTPLSLPWWMGAELAELGPELKPLAQATPNATSLIEDIGMAVGRALGAD